MRYIVLPSDTIFSIAEKFSVAVDDLIKENNLEYIYNLIPGLEIIIPNSTASDDVVDNPKGDFNDDINSNQNNNINMNEYSYYIVEKGDNLYQIGKRYNVSPEFLASINGINVDDIIYPDQQILVPNSDVNMYITKDGDTLQSVIDNLDISLEELISKNKDLFLKENITIKY